MALVVCCPCGNPLECDELELIVTLDCPHCRQELTLEFEDSDKRRRRAVLTVMEGPHWIGERFIVPVDTTLRLGRALGNWLSLDGDGVSDTHCELRLTKRGSLVIEDLGSEKGTWVGKQRISRGRLADRQSFRVGEFRLRVDFQSSDGGPAVEDGTPVDDHTKHLPEMAQVIEEETPGVWITRHRFVAARWFLTSFAWLSGAFHWSHLWHEANWTWYKAAATGLVILILFAELGRRMALVNPPVNYVALASLLALTIFDAFVPLAPEAVASLLMIVALSILIVRPPTHAQSITGILLAVAASTTMAVRAIPATIEALSTYLGSLNFDNWPPSF